MARLNRRQLLLLLLYLRRRRRCKEFWVHPLIRERYITGAFYVHHAKLRQHEEKFFNYYRMSTTTFDYILYHIKDSITLQNTNYRTCIPPTEMFAVTLRYVVKYYSITATRRRMLVLGRSVQVVMSVCVTNLTCVFYLRRCVGSNTFCILMYLFE